MAKAGMRRPDPEEPHGTEADQRNHFKRIPSDLYPKFRERPKKESKRHGLYKINPLIFKDFI